MALDQLRLFSRRLAALFVAVVMVLSLVPAPALAATFEDINFDDVWNPHTYEDGGFCVLSANAMLLRRTAMMNGDKTWANITYKKIAASSAVVADTSASVPAVKWSYTYRGISVARAKLSGTTASVKEKELITLLKAHPEGIVLYSSSHTILLTDYTDGIFWCCETHPYLFAGRMPLSQSIVTIDAATAYWYVTSPVTKLDPSVPVTSVSFSQSQVNVPLGASITLKPTVLPANNTNRTVSWESSDPWIASVDDNGVVTGCELGTTTITFTAGGKSATCEVTVGPVAVRTVSLDSPAITIDEGDAVVLRVSYKPSNATDPTFSWYNENNDIAWLEASGETARLNVYQPGQTVVTVVADGTNAYAQCVVTVRAKPESGTSMHRLYNPWSGEHFYTASTTERDHLITYGWRYEGIAWTAPETSETPVYRLYNKWAGDHHYTTSEEERDQLVEAGWIYEAIGWYSDDAMGEALLRQYNPYAATGTHNYTTSQNENDYLVSLGWHSEGVGWYGMLVGEDAVRQELDSAQEPVVTEPQATETEEVTVGAVDEEASVEEPAGDVPASDELTPVDAAEDESAPDHVETSAEEALEQEPPDRD